MTAVIPVQFFKSFHCFLGNSFLLVAYNKLVFRQHWEVQSRHRGWRIRESTQLSLTYLGAINLLYYLLKIKKLQSSASCSAVIHQSRRAYTILRATDPVAYYFWSCLRSCPAPYTLSRNVMQNQAFASCCIVCADPLLRQNKHRTQGKENQTC